VRADRVLKSGHRVLVCPLFVVLILAACASPAATTPAANPSPTSSATVACATPPPPLPTIGQPADDGARMVKVDTLDDRTRDLTIESPAVGTVMVRLLLPRTFASQPEARFPVLYLLHGGGGEYTDWTQNTNVEAYTAPTDLLVVMPAANSSGLDGWYTDWAEGGTCGPRLWETFHLTELRQLLERNWQAGDRRAIAGLSLGGYGSITYAARHPGLFAAAASYSGALDLRGYFERFPDPYEAARWGDPVTDASNWDGHDPIELAPQLRGTAVYLSFGTGQPGPLDPPGADEDQLEAFISGGNQRFLAALTSAGISATVDAYGPGTHSWPYWDRELRASLPLLLRALGESPAATSSP